MTSRSSRFFICIILVFFITLPVQSKNLRNEVIIECLNHEGYIGRLIEVSRDKIRIFRNNEIKNIDISAIKKIGLKRRSRFLSGISRGFLLGAIPGVGIGISNENNPDKEWGMGFYVFTFALIGSVIGAIQSLTIPKYKFYNFNSLSDSEKTKLLRKLKRKAG